jgi:Zn-finger protein
MRVSNLSPNSTLETHVTDWKEEPNGWMKTTNTVEITCCVCGTLFAMEEQLDGLRHKDGGLYYCPNGHSQHYTKSAAKLIADLKQKQNEMREELSEAKTEITRLKCQLLRY